MLFIQTAEQNNIPLDWHRIKVAAARYADILKIPEEDRIKFSTGRQCRFQERFDLQLNRIHGERGDVDMDAVQGRLLVIVLVMYTTSMRPHFFYRNSPTTTISNRPILDFKKDKRRLTVGVCVNADGSDMREPIIMGHAANPKCFNKECRKYRGPSIHHAYHV